eukprot:jgi/Mesvir1/14350/Mv09757-RA.1
MSSLSRELVFLILQFLYEEKYKETVHKLEQESGYFFNMKYFEDAVLAGSWDEVDKYLSGFIKVHDNRYSTKIFFELKKQKYLEALDRNDRLAALDILTKELKVFQASSDELYKEMTQLLTLNNFRENAKLSRYGNIVSARNLMLMELKQLIEANPQFRGKLEFPSLKISRLRTLINQSLNWQHQLCQNPKPSPDITTLFEDHTCGPALEPLPLAGAGAGIGPQGGGMAGGGGVPGGGGMNIAGPTGQYVQSAGYNKGSGGGGQVGASGYGQGQQMKGFGGGGAPQTLPPSAQMAPQAQVARGPWPNAPPGPAGHAPSVPPMAAVAPKAPPLGAPQAAAGGTGAAAPTTKASSGSKRHRAHSPALAGQGPPPAQAGGVAKPLSPSQQQSGGSSGPSLGSNNVGQGSAQNHAGALHKRARTSLEEEPSGGFAGAAASSAVDVEDLPRKVVATLQPGVAFSSIDFHPQDPKLLLAGTATGDIMLWDIGLCEKLYEKREPVPPSLRLPPGTSMSVNRVVWNSTAQFFGVAFLQNMVHIYAHHGKGDVQEHVKVEAHDGAVNDLAFTYPAQRLSFITCGDDKTIKVWDLETGAQQLVFEGHEGPVYCVCPHRKENIQFIFSTARDGKIMAWLYDNLGSRIDYLAPCRWCTTMQYSADGMRLFSCGTSQDGESSLVEWNESEGSIKQRYKGFYNPSHCIARFHTLLNRYLVAGDAGQVKFWHMDRIDPVLTIDAEGGLGSCPLAVFNCKGTLLAVTGETSIKILANAEGERDMWRSSSNGPLGIAGSMPFNPAAAGRAVDGVTRIPAVASRPNILAAAASVSGPATSPSSGGGGGGGSGSGCGSGSGGGRSISSGHSPPRIKHEPHAEESKGARGSVGSQPSFVPLAGSSADHPGSGGEGSQPAGGSGGTGGAVVAASAPGTQPTSGSGSSQGRAQAPAGVGTGEADSAGTGRAAADDSGPRGGTGDATDAVMERGSQVTAGDRQAALPPKPAASDVEDKAAPASGTLGAQGAAAAVGEDRTVADGASELQGKAVKTEPAASTQGAAAAGAPATEPSTGMASSARGEAASQRLPGIATADATRGGEEGEMLVAGGSTQGPPPCPVPTLIFSSESVLREVLPQTAPGASAARLLFTHAGTALCVVSGGYSTRLWKLREASWGGKVPHLVPEAYAPTPNAAMINMPAPASMPAAGNPTQSGPSYSAPCPPPPRHPCGAVSTNDLYVLSAVGGKISLFNLTTFKSMATFLEPPPAASFLCFHPRDNNIMAIGLDDGRVQIYDVRLDSVRSCVSGVPGVSSNTAAGAPGAASLSLVRNGGGMPHPGEDAVGDQAGAVVKSGEKDSAGTATSLMDVQHPHRITGLAFSTALEMLVTATASGHVATWGMASWNHVGRMYVGDGEAAGGGDAAHGVGDEGAVRVAQQGCAAGGGARNHSVSSSMGTGVQFASDLCRLLVVRERSVAVYQLAPTFQRECQWGPGEGVDMRVMAACFNSGSTLVLAMLAQGDCLMLSAATLNPVLQLRAAALIPRPAPSPVATFPDVSAFIPTSIAAHPKRPGTFAIGYMSGVVQMIEPRSGSWQELADSLAVTGSSTIQGAAVSSSVATAADLVSPPAA